MTLFSLILSSLFRGSADGAYTIFGGTANEARVFCDMTGASTGCNGGGWTLVMRIDGHKVYITVVTEKQCVGQRIRTKSLLNVLFRKYTTN